MSAIVWTENEERLLAIIRNLERRIEALEPKASEGSGEGKP